ncbi:hypothetical protein Pmar_PMAR016857 [Perkinsus marinus ATCC 50983]|uniref:Uncharacterized protein n=2 Tax=Perkinsus marinus (strain ATCC 50983 / TXsc) TaxID=423536 RepID=C5LX74_PERM5|nr:hypothetical protein Pmar_PMAR016857 [Perkinsus marinus ATCC 50983]EEQ98623.1 hypothetical protein Pmar_PMAR016857 [Perkinsus marinus ATCC 50983]|eukprot:XP_002765906.1 hypothetical protein Pmar_PMAR016857 [Perkinsus marinus ATCC 50983]
MATPSELRVNEPTDGDIHQAAGECDEARGQVLEQFRPSFIESAGAFNTPNSLASELKKARIYKGRVRGQLGRLEEQAGNIIINNEEDEALVAQLGEQEEQLRRVLDEAGAYVVALEMRYDEINEQNSRRMAGSRVFNSAGSIRSSYLQSNIDAEEDYRPLPRDRVSPRASLSESQRRQHAQPLLSRRPETVNGMPISDHRGVQSFHLTRPLVRSRANENDPLPVIPPSRPAVVTGLPDLGPEDSASAIQRPFYHHRMLPQSYAENPRKQQLVGPALSAQPFCDAGTIGKLSIGNLKDIFRVTAHIKRVESILAEANAGRFIDGQFLPHGHLSNACKEKLVGTLKDIPKCHEEADKACDIDGSTWFTVTKALKDQFARRTVLTDELDIRLKKLKFSSAKQVDTFVKEATSIADLYRVVYPDDRAQELHLVRKVVSCLPKDVAIGVIRRCKKAGRGDSEQDWETCVPFYSPTGRTRETVVEFIRAECRLSEEFGSLLSLRPDGRDGGQDSVRAIHSNDGRAGKDKGQVDRGESLPNFVSRFSIVYGITGRGCRNESHLRSLVGADGMIPRFNKQGMKYFFVGYKDKETGSAKVNALPKDQFRSWEFQFKEKPKQEAPLPPKSGN